MDEKRNLPDSVLNILNVDVWNNRATLMHFELAGLMQAINKPKEEFIILGQQNKSFYNPIDLA